MSLAELPLLELIPKLSDNFKPPYHLASWCKLIERAATEPVRGMCSVPIRHYKTETTCAGIIYLLLRHPNWRIIFLTHSAEAAMKWGKRIRQLAEATDIGPTKNWNTIAEWRNSEGGGVVIMSADQSKIGYDCDALIVDDPLDEHGAEDPNVREAVDEAISMYTARCMKQGKRGPVLIVASRFHPDDPIGRRLTRRAVNWEYIFNQAIRTKDDGTEEAFAPDIWPLEELYRTRAELAERDPTERIWWAQFQNEPRAAGSDLFKTPRRWTELPPWHHRVAYGCDFAFSQSSSADWFAAVALRIYSGQAYVLEVRRERLDPNLIEQVLKGMIAKYGRAPVFSYQSGPEIGLTNVLLERGVPIARMLARYNKLVRAERTIRRWNDGNILVPVETDALWVPGFLHRVASFRGHEKDQDDEVDALVSACDGAWGSVAGFAPHTVGQARM